MTDAVLLLGYSGSRVLAEARVQPDGTWRVGVTGAALPNGARYSYREARIELERAGARQIQAFDAEAVRKWSEREAQWGCGQ